jgi:glycogen debranching enzyme
MTDRTLVRSWEYRPDVFGGVEDISDTLVIREQGVFLLTDSDGNVPKGNRRGLGLYGRDTRHLSEYCFTLNGAVPVLLLSAAETGYGMEQVMGNHRMVAEGQAAQIGRCTVELHRQRVLTDILEEYVDVTNFNLFDVELQAEYSFSADFADIFEVRGHERQQPGQVLHPEVSNNSVTFRYLGADGEMRLTRLTFDPPPDSLTPDQAVFLVGLKPRQTRRIRLMISLDPQTPAKLDTRQRRRALVRSYTRWRESFTGIHTNNEIFNRVLNRSIDDLRMLLRDERGRRFFGAGTPWFDTLFGRDSMITALQVLPLYPAIGLDCLHMMARYQGENVDPFRMEERGKILHEMRQGELCAIGELPYQRYYGSVDSTPLFLLLAGEYFRWTNDTRSMVELKPAILGALHWLRTNAARNAHGFITYETDSPTGLRNQGWKDSEDGICHADGSLCEGPVALPEVQGYVYAAYRLLAPLLRALDEDEEARRVLDDAEALRRAFGKRFWIGEAGLIPMAIDGRGAPSGVMSSNAGQALWSGILGRARAQRVSGALMDNDMFSGWGIRTLARSAVAFNPVGYHVGTIWPHDNAIVIAGLKRYGFDEEANELITALFDAASAFQSYRLPEAFGGQPRSPGQPPVPYPVACRPQAWAAGTMLHVLQSMLGLTADAQNDRLYLVRPRLPYWLSSVHLTGLRLGHGSVDLSFIRQDDRTRVKVANARNLEVVRVARWPEIS